MRRLAWGAGSTPCRACRRLAWICWPRLMPERRCGCLPHDHSPSPIPNGSRGVSHPDTRGMRIGVGGPVGSGKTALVAALCRALGADLRLGVVTNDIYTTEAADILRAAGVLDAERIVAVQTGCCPHTAIGDDITANLDAVEDLEARSGPLDLVLVESGGDNLTAIFSYGLVDTQIFVLDVSGGDKVPRKGGPGVTASDLLVINKTDLAPLVGASLTVMNRDATAVRQGRPGGFCSLRQGPLAPAASARGGRPPGGGAGGAAGRGGGGVGAGNKPRRGSGGPRGVPAGAHRDGRGGGAPPGDAGQPRRGRRLPLPRRSDPRAPRRGGRQV